MPISLKEFWKLAIDTGLLLRDECQRLNEAFGLLPGAEQGNSATLAQWLIASGVLTRYQAQALLAGKRRQFVFGPYRVVDRHESGRLKGIYRATHLESGRAAALYFLSRELLQNANQVALVERQTREAAAVREPHLASVFEFVRAGSAALVAFEDLAGTTLAEPLGRGRLAPAVACRTMADVALALAALHAAGQAHGDVRPENIWLSADGTVKLLGFPLARNPIESAPFGAAANPSPRLSRRPDYPPRVGRRTANRRMPCRTFIAWAACCTNCWRAVRRLPGEAWPSGWADMPASRRRRSINWASRSAWRI